MLGKADCARHLGGSLNIGEELTRNLAGVIPRQDEFVRISKCGGFLASRIKKNMKKKGTSRPDMKVNAT